MKWILLNPKARGSTALKVWQKIATSYSGYRVVNLEEIDFDRLEFSSGDQIICAGGDGTLNWVVSRLIARHGLSAVKSFEFGLIGLGSNNSFLMSAGHQISKARVSSPARPHDLVECRLEDGSKKYFLANASVGLLAEANFIFNQDKIVKSLKSYNRDVADTLTFLKAIKSFKSSQIKVTMDGKTREQNITNLHFLKHPYFAADLFFDETGSEDDGLIHFFSLESMPKLQILKRFIDMMLFKKMSRGYTAKSSAKHLSLECKKAFAIELDGEVYRTHSAQFTNHKNALQFLQRG